MQLEVVKVHKCLFMSHGGFDLAYGYLQEADQNTAGCAVDNQVNEYQTSPFSGESASGSITSSYLDLGRAADMLNSTGLSVVAFIVFLS